MFRFFFQQVYSEIRVKKATAGISLPRSHGNSQILKERNRDSPLYVLKDLKIHEKLKKNPFLKFISGDLPDVSWLWAEAPKVDVFIRH